MLINAIFQPALLNDPANQLNIAICHAIFNVICTAILLPQGGLLEKPATRLVPDDKKPKILEELDERLLSTPPLALERCRMLGVDLANTAAEALNNSVICLNAYTPERAQFVRDLENKTDHYEDILDSYLVKLSTQAINESDSAEAAGLLKLIGDFERIADHAANIIESAEEMQEKGITFTDGAKDELAVICSAVEEVVIYARDAFANNDLTAAAHVEPLEEVVDDLKETLRSRHIRLLQRGQCSIEVGFVWSDLLTGLERVSDHSSNIAVCVIDMARNNMNQHEVLKNIRTGSDEFEQGYKAYGKKYPLKPENTTN